MTAFVHRLWHNIPLLDRVGSLASVACAIHCVGGVVLLSLFPALSLGVFHDERVHAGMAVIVFFVGGAAFVRGYRVHRDRHALLSGALGTAIVCWAAIHPFSTLSDSAETMVTLAGTAILLWAHYRNWRALPSH